MDIEIIDIDYLHEQFNGDKEILNQFLNICIQELPERIAQLKQAIAENDSTSIKINAHTIKGISLNMGATALRQAAIDLENACIKKDMKMIHMFFEILEHEFSRLKSNLLNIVRQKF